MVSLTKEIQYVNKQGKEIYDERRTELELDSFNLLYVALTRAAEQLHIITEKKLDKKGIENPRYYSGVFISFLKENNLWDDDKNEYSFGSFVNIEPLEKQDLTSQIQEEFISTPWKNHNITLLANSSKLWGTKRGEAKDYGNFLHKILSEVITKEDVAVVLEKQIQQGELSLEEKNQLQEIISSIISHPKLKEYYSKDVTVYNEREIVHNNQIVIPDRLVFDKEKKVTIIDYKTGVSKKEHHFQLENYGSVLESLNYSVKKKVLIYSNEKISIEEF